MATTTKNTHRVTIALSLPRQVPLLIVSSQRVLEHMTGNPTFANPNPPLTALSAAIAALQTAEAAALGRAKGAVATRNEKRTALIGVLQQVRSYVQTTADADPANAMSIIEGAGMTVRKSPTHRARAFVAKQGPVSGVAQVVAQVAARRASYDWQYSIDGGKTWVALPSTLQAKTTVAGLTPGSTVQFKYRALTKSGEGDWSQPTSLMVH